MESLMKSAVSVAAAMLVWTGSASAEAFDLRCKAGGQMVVYLDIDCAGQTGEGPELFARKTEEGLRQECHVAPRFWFKPAAKGADVAPLKPGECSWPHRALNKQESRGANGQGLVPVQIKHKSYLPISGVSIFPDGSSKVRYKRTYLSSGELIDAMKQPGKNFTIRVSFRTYPGQDTYDHAFDDIGRGLKGKHLWLEKVF